MAIFVTCQFKIHTQNKVKKIAHNIFRRLAWIQNSCLAKKIGNTQLVIQSDELVKHAEFGKQEDSAQ